MNWKHLIIITLATLALASQPAQAQKRLARIANQAWQAGEYFEAVEKYKKLYGKTKDNRLKAKAAYRMGVAYSKMNQPNLAVTWLRSATFFRYNQPHMYLLYAQSLMKTGNYEEARKQFEEYSKLVPDDPRAGRGIKSCEKTLEWQQEEARYVVEAVRALNSPQSDFGPAYAGGPDLVYFTSTRENATGDEQSGITGASFADIFYSLQDRKGDWSQPVPAKGDINTKYDEGAPCLVDDGFTIFYTGCKIIDNKKMGCKIYTAERKGQEWGEPGILDLFPDSAISVGHPAVTEDGLTMYFASDHEDGLGGRDIWMSTRASSTETWGKPVNLGDSINTRGNELYPFIRDNDELYFSSDGRVGMGGLDIFRAVKQENGSWKVENMKPPINSSSDDFGIVFEYGQERGMFSSSRNNYAGTDKIYSFELPPLVFKLKGKVLERESEKPLEEVDVKLFGSNGAIKEEKTTEEGGFAFDLDEETDYRLVTTKKDYLKGKGKETTRGLDESKTLTMQIMMAPIDKPIELPNILYDLDKADLRPESMVSLNQLVETLNDNPNVSIELAAHTDSRGPADYNQDLSQRRAQSVVDYLIGKGIDPERLTPQGYGEERPKTIIERIASQYDFLEEGNVLTEAFINNLETTEQKEIAYQINRRTEFEVLSTDYKN